MTFDELCALAGNGKPLPRSALPLERVAYRGLTWLYHAYRRGAFSKEDVYKRQSLDNFAGIAYNKKAVSANQPAVRSSFYIPSPSFLEKDVYKRQQSYRGFPQSCPVSEK